MAVRTPMLMYVDPVRTPWYDRFFSTWSFDNADDLLAAIDGVELSVDAVSRSDDLERLGLSGWLYWTLYIKGYLQYLRGRDLGRDNVYLDYLVRYGRSHNHDPGVVDEFASPERARARIESRFRDFDTFRRASQNNWQDDTEIVPMTCRILRERQIDTKPLVDTESGAAVDVSLLDGYHRLFLARLFGLARIPCLVTDETTVEGPVESSTEEDSHSTPLSA